MSTEAKEAPAAAAAPAGGGGIKAMLPLILNLVLMPAVAFALTQFVLLPKLKAPAPAAHGAPAEGEDAHATEDDGGHGAAEDSHGAKDDGHGAPKEDAHGGGGGDAHGGGGKAAKSAKAPVPLSSKILVNVSGTMGSRFLQANISVVGAKKNLSSLVEEFDAQLRDTASSVLAAKTLADLEKTGSRNLIKAELVGAFNHVLGQGSVTDVFLTDFAVQ